MYRIIVHATERTGPDHVAWDPGDTGAVVDYKPGSQRKHGDYTPNFSVRFINDPARWSGADEWAGREEAEAAAKEVLSWVRRNGYDHMMVEVCDEDDFRVHALLVDL